ncbi:type IV pilus assembly protein PilM, partial [Candidatus Margulisiibacteriota bacterium]
GLDIDEKSVKFVTLSEQGSKKILTKFAIKEIPPSEDKIAATADIIKQIMAEENIKPGSRVFTCVYGVGPTIRRISIPVMPDQEIAEAVKWEIRNLIPFSIEGAVVDYYKIGKVTEKSVEKYDILAAVVQHETLDKLLAICGQAGLQLQGISPIPFALWNLVKESIEFKEDEIIAIIDIGAEAASLNLFKNNILQFTRDITVAGDSITKAMTGMLVADEWQLNLSYEQAEEIKMNCGIPAEGTTEKTKDGVPLIHILEMISPTLRRLRNEILRSFDYYKDQFREEKIDKVFLTGGSSKLKNLDGYLSEALGIKVEILEPMKNIDLSDDLKNKEQKLNEYLPRLSLSIGLALGHAEMINFLRILKPPRQKIQLPGFLQNVNIPMPSKTAVAATTALFIMIISFNVYLAVKRNSYRSELRDKQIILADIKALHQRKAVLADIAKKETHIRSILAQLTTTFPKGILLTNLIYDNNKKQVWLTGTAPYTGMAGKLVKNLEDSGYFKNVILLEIKKPPSATSGSQVIFRLTARLE